MGDTQDLVEPIVKPFTTVGGAGKSHVQTPVLIPQFLWVTGSHPLPVYAPPPPLPNVVFEEVLNQLIEEQRVFTQFVKAVFHIIRVNIRQGRQATDCNVELHVFCERLLKFCHFFCPCLYTFWLRWNWQQKTSVPSNSAWMAFTIAVSKSTMNVSDWMSTSPSSLMIFSNLL